MISTNNEEEAFKKYNKAQEKELKELFIYNNSFARLNKQESLSQLEKLQKNTLEKLNEWKKIVAENAKKEIFEKREFELSKSNKKQPESLDGIFLFEAQGKKKKRSFKKKRRSLKKKKRSFKKIKKKNKK